MAWRTELVTPTDKSMTQHAPMEICLMPPPPPGRQAGQGDGAVQDLPT